MQLLQKFQLAEMKKWMQILVYSPHSRWGGDAGVKLTPSANKNNVCVAYGTSLTPASLNQQGHYEVNRQGVMLVVVNNWLLQQFASVINICTTALLLLVSATV